MPETALALRVHDFDSAVYDVDGDAAASISDNLSTVCGSGALEDDEGDEEKVERVTYARRKDVRTLAEGYCVKGGERKEERSGRRQE